MPNNVNAMSIPQPPGDVSIIPIRASAILTTSIVIADAHNGDTTGWFNMQGCPILNLWVTFTIGSLTNIVIDVQATDSSQAAAYGLVMHEIAAGNPVILPEAVSWSFPASATQQVAVNNPGAAFMRVRAIGVGTVTSSLLAIGITRSWGTVLPYNS